MLLFVACAFAVCIWMMYVCFCSHVMQCS